MINDSKKLVGPFLIDLKNRFREIAGEDRLIDKDEFRKGLDIVNEDISDRLFELFDKDSNGNIDYDEFMDTIESMIQGSEKDKIQFAFKLHDLDNSGYIDRKELKILIQQSFYENNLDYDEFQLDLLVDDFFKKADKDNSGTIDFNEFLAIAKDYPDFIEGFAVNPLHWLIPDRNHDGYLDNQKRNDSDKIFSSKIQVQDIGVLQWFLIPRLIFLYNVLINRKKNRTFVDLQSLTLLPSKVIELTISSPEDLQFKPGDYLYINFRELSRLEWYPFNIIRHTDDNDLVLHVKSNNFWTNKLYNAAVEFIGKDTTLNWKIRIDGPYGSSSHNILKTDHAVLIAAGYGISRIAPILQDIMLKLKKNPEDISISRVDLYWLIEDDSYFEWFTMMLHKLNEDYNMEFFNYHIFFLDKFPDDINKKMMYITTDVSKNKTETKLVNNLWSVSRFGIPKWDKELTELNEIFKDKQPVVFYSGPSKLIKSIKKQCSVLGIDFKKGYF